MSCTHKIDKYLNVEISTKSIPIVQLLTRCRKTKSHLKKLTVAREMEN